MYLLKVKKQIAQVHLTAYTNFTWLVDKCLFFTIFSHTFSFPKGNCNERHRALSFYQIQVWEILSLDKLKVKSSSLHWAHQLWKSKFRGKALKNQMNTDLKNVKSFRKNYRKTYKVLGNFLSWWDHKKDTEK